MFEVKIKISIEQDYRTLASCEEVRNVTPTMLESAPVDLGGILKALLEEAQAKQAEQGNND